jgi:hypothetical protein
MQNVAAGNFPEWPPVYPNARTNDAPRDVSALAEISGCPLTNGADNASSTSDLHIGIDDLFTRGERG